MMAAPCPLNFALTSPPFRVPPPAVDLVRQAMLYSKARITLTSGGATTTNVTLHSDGAGDALLKAQPLFLPSLLGYDISGRVAKAATAGGEDGGFLALGPLGGSASVGTAAIAAAAAASDYDATSASAPSDGTAARRSKVK